VHPGSISGILKTFLRPIAAMLLLLHAPTLLPMCVSLYMCLYVCKHTYTSICIPEANSSDAAAVACADTSPDVRVSVCIHVCVCVCIYTYIDIYTYTYICTYIYVYICIYIYIDVCVYLYIYIPIYVYIRVHSNI